MATLLHAAPAAATEDPGDVFTTGWNHRGQLGNGTTVDELAPVEVVGLAGGGIVDLAGGRWHSVALAADGTVYSWGRNEYGQLGVGSIGGLRNTATVVSGLGGVTVVDVAAGHYHSLALTDTGDLYIWGRNDTAQLAIADLQPRGTPTLVSSLSNVAAISGGRNHTAVALDDGSVWTWGDNTQRQLGDGSAVAMRTAPVSVSTATGIEPIASLKAGRDHTLAISDDGSLWVWGGNVGGQIGNGTKVAQSTPQERVLGGPVADAAGGAYHSVVALADGSAQAWGRNAFGQIGVGSSSYDFTTPQIIPSVSTALSVGSGRDHSLIALSDGTALAFGRNDKGQLGDSTTNDRDSPVAMVGVSDITVVEGGRGHSRLLSTIGGGTTDTTPPDGAWIEPVNNQTYARPLTMTGNATDNVGVDTVEMIVRDLTTNQYWNPATATWGSFNRFAVSVDAQGATATGFSFLFDPPPSAPGAYRARFWVTDQAGNENTGVRSIKFNLSGADGQSPAASWTAPGNNSTGPAPISLEGAVSDNVGVDRVELVIRDRGTGLYWDGSGWGSYERFDVPVANQGASNTSFSYSFDPPGSGNYRARVWAIDTSENRTTAVVNRNFSIS